MPHADRPSTRPPYRRRRPRTSTHSPYHVGTAKLSSMGRSVRVVTITDTGSGSDVVILAIPK